MWRYPFCALQAWLDYLQPATGAVCAGGGESGWWETVLVMRHRRSSGSLRESSVR